MDENVGVLLPQGVFHLLVKRLHVHQQDVDDWPGFIHVSVCLGALHPLLVIPESPL